jgi:hypothetical protein
MDPFKVSLCNSCSGQLIPSYNIHNGSVDHIGEERTDLALTVALKMSWKRSDYGKFVIFDGRVFPENSTTREISVPIFGISAKSCSRNYLDYRITKIVVDRCYRC